jgi:hydrogenase maturation protein HypF
VIAHDLHPAYLSTQWAKKQQGVDLVGVQHHHAHIASCMAENQRSGPVIGIALDGTGYGTDGHAWGGEVLIADLQVFQRAAHLEYAPMPGGVQAIHEPWRMAVSHLWVAFGEEWRSHAPASLFENLSAGSVAMVEKMLRNDAHLPLTSSCGRLFDAVAALACNRTLVSYEAQAAIALEACCVYSDAGAYPFSIREGHCLQIETAPLFAALAEDLRLKTPAGIMSRRFHTGLIEVLAETVSRIAGRSGLEEVCLSGGSFQNSILSEGLEKKLTLHGLRVFTHSQVPPGDGGLSLGQLVIAAHQR